jgi:predicted dehydrogenase
MIRIATIGTSGIAACMLGALSNVEGAVFVGTLSRDRQRAAAFTSEHGGTTPFTSLDELAASDEVDAVYIGSPNALHHNQALACIAGGKHVIVEKPFCANRREAAEVFEAARDAGVVALEAMRPLHDPAFHAIKDALPQIGAIRRATLRFGKYSSRYDEILAGRHTNIFDCAMASGSLMDIGVYCVEPLIELFGAPERIFATGALLNDETRGLTNGPIDGSGVILASYPHMTAILAHSKTTNDLSDSQIEGELGTLAVHGISAPSSMHIDLRSDAARQTDSVGYSSAQTVGRDIDLPAFENTMQHELSDFIEAVEHVRTGDVCTEAPCGLFGNVAHFRDITLSSLALMDEARRQMGVSFPADRTAPDAPDVPSVE